MSDPQYKETTVFERTVYALAVLFFIKAAIVGIWIIRPWDVPDEVGHFSYIKNLAEGENFPVLHETFIDSDVWEEFCEFPMGAGENWIAQHPPLYPILMVPVYWIGSYFGESFWGSFYLIRLMSSLMFGVGLVMFVRTLLEAGASRAVALGCGIIMASVPTGTFLAAGVNHDPLVFMLGAFVSYYWVRYLKTTTPRDLICFGIFIGLGMITKYTMLVLAIPTVAIVGLRWFNSENKSPKVLLFASAFTFLPIGLWMLRNLSVLGELLPVDMSGFASTEPMDVGIIGFFGELGLFSNFYQSFWGLIGWMGDKNLQLRWLHIQPAYLKPLTWVMLLLLILGVLGLIREKLKDTRKRAMVCVVVGALMPILFWQLGWFSKEIRYLLPLYCTCLVFVGIGLTDLGYIFTAGDFTKNDWIERTALGVVAFFIVIYCYKVFSVSVPSGNLQASFGRYLFPVIGFLAIAIMVPVSRLFNRLSVVVLGGSIIFPFIELYFWIQEVLPFFS